MSAHLRWEQCCESQDCTRPARHGGLCAACFRAATPARRAAELAADRAADRIADPLEGLVNDDGAAWLERLWAA
jgi:hypothetical protein